MIIPNLRLSLDSQMRVAIRNLTAEIRGAYDNAIFTERLQRLVLNIKTGEYWVEEAPLGFQGRAPSVEIDDSVQLAKDEDLKNMINDFEQEQKDFSSRSSLFESDHKKVVYTIRSIPVVQKSVLNPIKWEKINDAILYKQILPEKIIFAEFYSTLFKNPLKYSDIDANKDKSLINDKNKDKNYFGYIYFLPDGTATSTSIRLSNKIEKESSDHVEKYTLNLNTLTGQTHLLEGFQDANFSVSK